MIYEINILSTKERFYQAQAKNNLALNQYEINIRILNSNCGRLVTPAVTVVFSVFQFSFFFFLFFSINDSVMTVYFGKT